METIGQLIIKRKEAREEKNWAVCDEIRNYLDEKLVFIFDGSNGQEVYSLNEGYFKRKNDYIKIAKIKEGIEEAKLKIESGEKGGLEASLESFKEALVKNEKLKSMTNRQYVEYKIQQDIAAEKLFDSWLYSMLSSVKK